MDNYLKNQSPASDGIYYIEVTGLQAANLKGDPDNGKPSPLGKILIANRTKKVALKFGGGITGLTDMSYCFHECESLVQAPEIPESVTDMKRCFQDCGKLTKAPPAIPKGVTNMEGCFYGCESLMQAPAIPANAAVTTMESCFQNCVKLTQGPEIPASVKKMSSSR